MYDPILDRSNLNKKYKAKLLNNLNKRNFYDIIILAVPHKIFIAMGIKKIKKLGRSNSKVFDLKSVFPKKETYWQI